jgi:hypothetical protein
MDVAVWYGLLMTASEDFAGSIDVDSFPKIGAEGSHI